jgi:hypothetical protein
MNYPRLVLSALGAFVAYFAFGFLAFAVLPLKGEFQKYPAVYRSQDGVKAVMPLGMLGMLMAILALTVLYALVYRGGSGAVVGLEFGALVGLFTIGSFVLHNYVNLNIGLKLTLQQSAMYFLEWVIVGLVMGLIYKPALSPAALP